MKVKVIICKCLSTLVIISPLLYIMYRLGYCNGCDKYIGASECKPKRYLNFLGD